MATSIITTSVGLAKNRTPIAVILHHRHVPL